MYSKMSTWIIAILTASSLFASEFSDAQAKVKAKYPEEFEEILKLAETDFDAARKKLNTLAGKANIKLPDETDNGRSDSSRGGQFGGRRGQSGNQPGSRGGQFGGRGGQFGGRGGGAMSGRMGGASAEPPKELVEDSNLRRLEFSSRNGELKYCEFLENGDTEGPMWLVLIMHGMSNCGNDNLKQLASPSIKPLLFFLRQHKIKALVLIPQCPDRSGWVRGNTPMLDMVYDLVNAKRKELDIPTERSIITGVSMGGGGCYFFMMQHPNVFKRAIVVSSGGMEKWASKLSGEFYIAVGTEDQFISVDKVEQMARELGRTQKVRFEKLSGMDHIEAAQKVYNGDCWNWAFDQK